MNLQSPNKLNTRYFIQLSYKGTNYHGWQIQPNAITVQETLNNILTIILKQKINAVGAGRTDTGVHASYFMAHFDLQNKQIDCENITFKLNRFLPEDIAIQKIFKVQNSAHARFDAISRTYNYFITKVKNPFITDSHWYVHYKMNIDIMNKAAKILFEYSDFTSFSKLHTDVKTNICKIYEAYWEVRNNELVFIIKADRFLRNMVRAIVGTLIDVGREKLNLDDFKKIIENKNRCNAGMSVPSKGLHLCDIKYPDNIQKPMIE